ncbi:MAG: hypothetical protein QGI10_03040 [Vicinamibacterales bacterium]|jgi:hypothetical protein|nr:hypothetical protein [Vicinamibacterales bacterium]MDP7478222.1 hypothetical protein [Vicinamibacterales bacterium]HJN42636.1 hypothetical protein [Vicinamibacterales bacterium]
MNFSRVAVAAVVAWVAFVVIGYVVHSIILDDLYASQELAGIVETEPWTGFLLALLGFFVFAYVYAKGYEGGNGTQEGMRFGVLVAIMLICFAGVWGYVVFPISGGLEAALAIDYIVEFAAYGMIVGAIYKLPPRGASRPVRRRSGMPDRDERR